jgi:hypothetical protein
VEWTPNITIEKYKFRNYAFIKQMHSIGMSWGSPVRVVSDYGQGNWGLIPSRGKGFFF